MKKGKRINLILLVNILFLSHNVSAQNIDDKKLDIISKNIMSFHFRFALDYDLDLRSDKVLSGKFLFFEKLWLDKDKDLKLKYFYSELTYPLNDFRLFEIRKRRFQIGNDSTRISYQLSSLKADEIYLVAINTKNDEIKFISGNFFLSSIKEDFDLNIENKESFNYYVKVRTHNWLTDNIKYEKTRKGKIIFNAYSKFLGRAIFVKIDKNDFDNIEVVPSRKENGN